MKCPLNTEVGMTKAVVGWMLQPVFGCASAVESSPDVQGIPLMWAVSATRAEEYE